MKTSVREHLASRYSRDASHHVAMAKSKTQQAEACRAIAACFSKATDDEIGQAPGAIPKKIGAAQFESLAAAFADEASEHTGLAEFCAECVRDLRADDKAAADELGKSDQIRPDGVRATIPTDTPRIGSGVVAVPRVGQPSLVNSAGVPTDFADTFLKIEG